MSNTFYDGFQEYITNSETPVYLIPVSGLSNFEVICYGVKDSHNLTAFKWDELTDAFNYNKNFNNPVVESDVFSSISIRKLKNICKTIRLSEPESIKKAKRDLYYSIIVAELFQNNVTQGLKRLWELVNVDRVNAEKVVKTIQTLFEVSMYMRGWDGIGAFPIERAPVDNQITVDLNVTQAIAKFETLIAELREDGQTILNLPLLNYKSGQFIPLLDGINHLTIRKRLQIVKQGEDFIASSGENSYDSCIRLSSNYFAISSYRYFEIMGLEPPFFVSRLREIS
jgi:hypothetical protein